MTLRCDIRFRETMPNTFSILFCSSSYGTIGDDLKEDEMMTILPARIIHIGIDRPWRQVHAYAANPGNMRFWASGLASGLRQDGDDWVGDGGPLGSIRVRFAPGNPFGILDHTVKMENGLTVENHVRVIANADGAEVIFALIKRPDMDEDGFEADAAHVLMDLTTLKTVLESDV